MNLLKVLKGIDIVGINGPIDIDIKDISYDSRDIKESYMFICINGYNENGHKYIHQAIKNGAKAILIEEDIDYERDIAYIKVEDTKKSMAIIAKNFFENPCEKIDLIGITGTNGKTSTVGFIKQILQSKYKVGSMGTIEVYDGDNIVKSKNTTPSSLDINRSLYSMYKNKCKYCIMEVSSHALALNRVDGIEYKIGVFTNLTQDHLDFHKSIENYKREKEKLFYKTSYANLFNIDDKVGLEFYKSNKNKNVINYTYGMDKNADFRVKDIKLYSNKTQYTLIVDDREYKVLLPILGYFSVYNSLAAIAVCKLLGMDLNEIILNVKRLKNAPGRLDYIENEKGINIVVDYAHTPDAIQNLIKSVREFIEGKVILVFGCGGDRDKTKRHIMGKIAQDKADIVIITSDNPRFENPKVIIDDILSGMDKSVHNYLVIEDRKEAIQKAIALYEKEDLIIIAGKGHEDYQIIGSEKKLFNDRLIVQEILNQSQSNKAKLNK